MPSSWCSDGTGALPTSPWVPLCLPKSASAQEVGCVPGSGLATSTCSRCEHSMIPSASKRTVWGATVCPYHSPLVTSCDLFTGFLVLLVTPGWDRALRCQHHSAHRASGIHLPYDFQGLCSFLRHCISLKIHKLCSLKLLKSIPLPSEGFCWVAFDFIEMQSLTCDLVTSLFKPKPFYNSLPYSCTSPSSAAAPATYSLVLAEKLNSFGT